MAANSQVLGYTGEQTEHTSDILQGGPPLLDELGSKFLRFIWLLNYKYVFIELITLRPVDLSASKGRVVLMAHFQLVHVAGKEVSLVCPLLNLARSGYSVSVFSI